MDLALSPEELVIMLSTETEMVLPMPATWNDIRMQDQLTSQCPGTMHNFLNSVCVSEFNETVRDCCCNMKACQLGTFESVMTVMKDSILPAHVLHFNDSDPIFSQNIFNYNILPAHASKNITLFPNLFETKPPNNYDTKRFLNLEPYIPLCKLKKVFLSNDSKFGTAPSPFVYEYSFCTLFRPTFTDQGICYAFNAQKPENLFKPSEYLTAFLSVFGNQRTFEPQKITGIGKSNGLTLFLDAHTLTSSYKTGKHKAKDFQIGFDNFGSFSLPSNGGFQVSAGKKTSFVITPIVLESTEAVKLLTSSERNCQFPQESENSKFFSLYSHSGCIFECLWYQAVETCQCSSWKYPMPGNISDVCDHSGNICFKEVMNDQSRVVSCDCKPDCTKVSYDYYVIQEDLVPSVQCNEKEGTKPLIDYLKNYLPDQHMTKYWNLLNIVSNKTTMEGVLEADNNLCANRIKNDIAIIEIYFSSPFVTKIKKDVRTTFTDKISNIGKNNTIFTFCCNLFHNYCFDTKILIKIGHFCLCCENQVVGRLLKKYDSFSTA